MSYLGSGSDFGKVLVPFPVPVSAPDNPVSVPDNLKQFSNNKNFLHNNVKSSIISQKVGLLFLNFFFFLLHFMLDLHQNPEP